MVEGYRDLRGIGIWRHSIMTTWGILRPILLVLVVLDDLRDLIWLLVGHS